MTPIEFDSRADRDRKKLSNEVLVSILRALHELDSNRPPENLNVKRISGHSPWLRLRVGGYRVLFRLFRRDGETVILVGRLIKRTELDRAVRQLR